VASALEAAKAASQNAFNDTQAYANFKQAKKISSIEETTVEYHSTLCLTHRDKICHEHCGLQETTNAGDPILEGCTAFAGGHKTTCMICECPVSQHYHSKKLPKSVENTVEEILHDVKAKYDNAAQQHNRLQGQIATYEKDIAMIEVALAEKEQKIVKLCQELQKIVSHFNFIDEYQGVLTAMRTDARTLTQRDARTKADDLISRLGSLLDRMMSRR